MPVLKRKAVRVHTLAQAGLLASRLERGDVMLFKASDPDKHPIARFQRLFIPPYSIDAANFTHAACS